MRNGKLTDIGQGALRNLLGTWVSGNPGFSNDAAASQDVETDNAFDYCIGGRWYTNAADANIDISAAKGSDAGTYAPTNLADGYTRAFVFAIDASGNYYVIEGTSRANSGYATAALAAADVYANYLPDVHIITAAGVETEVCPFGILIVHNAAGAVYTCGTTALDGANVTDTYYDICRMPA